MSNQPQAEGQFKKDLRKIDIWSLALGAIIGWGCFVLPGTDFLPKAGPLGAILGLLLGAVIISIISFSYGYMIQKFPLSGGEFVYADSVFGKKHAFICGWSLVLAYWSLIPLNSTAVAMVSRYTESWVPFCMPGISEDGYLQLYCHFSDENIGVCLVTESVDPELFMKFSEQYQEINAKLMEGNFIDKIIQAQQKTSKSSKNQRNLNELTDDELIDELLSKMDIQNDKNNLQENSKLSKTMVSTPNRPMKSMTVSE